MKKIRLIDSDNLLKKQLKNPSFRKAYDDLKDEFALKKELLKVKYNNSRSKDE